MQTIIEQFIQSLLIYLDELRLLHNISKNTELKIISYEAHGDYVYLLLEIYPWFILIKEEYQFNQYLKLLFNRITDMHLIELSHKQYMDDEIIELIIRIDPLNKLLFIPKNRVVAQNDIRNLTNENIKDLIAYFNVAKFDIDPNCFKIFKDQIRNIFDFIQNDDILLVPGDSPYKLIQVLKLNYQTGNDEFTFDGIIKNFKTIEFPLSGISKSRGGPLGIQTNLIMYISKILDQIDMSKNFVMIDYVRSGDSYLKLRRIIAHLKKLSIPFFRQISHGMFMRDNILSLINLSIDQIDLLKCDNLNEFFDEAERYDIRCVPNYNLERIWDNTNLFNCNLIIMVMSVMMNDY